MSWLKPQKTIKLTRKDPRSVVATQEVEYPATPTGILTGRTKSQWGLEAILEGLYGFAAMPQEMIKNIPEPAAKALRKLMQVEMKKRGKAPLPLTKEISKPFVKMSDFDKPQGIVDPVDKALRSVFYRGQTTIPEAAVTAEGKLASNVRITSPGSSYGDVHVVDDIIAREGKPDFRHARMEEMNLGEPTGISLTLSPHKAAQFSKLKGEEFARVMPLYGAPPEEVILNAWTKKGGTTLKEVYKETVRELFPEGPPGTGPITWKDAKGIAKTSPSINVDSVEGLKNWIDKEGLRTKFNQTLTKKLQERGYKGILYSPHRFDEFELKMFNPEDVIAIDRRHIKIEHPPKAQAELDELSKQSIDPETGLISFKQEVFEKEYAIPEADRFPTFEYDPTFERLYPGGRSKTMMEFIGTPGAKKYRSLRDWYSQLEFGDLFPETGASRTTEFDVVLDYGLGGKEIVGSKLSHEDALAYKEWFLSPKGKKGIESKFDWQLAEDIEVKPHEFGTTHDSLEAEIAQAHFSKAQKLIKEIFKK